ncbi:DUF2298 domain-containing protein [Thermanaerothrix daxensis]|uniref:DUF2298 domain-containing protein n=1 Tax=Thermanaerothrix daxensis TaxID=869279 RepID=UPI0006C92A7D|nr:DUF2298 domain-containing protein [Thermanaerothrix daxensis]
MTTTPDDEKGHSHPTHRRLFWDALLILILLVGAYFRLVGLDWDEEQHLHPDERFMTMVASSVRSPGSLAEYFNTATSPLNPHVVGYGFYVYGTLPLFLVRWVGEALGKTGYGEIYLVGRVLSALADLFTVFLVYHIARHLYRRTGLGVLAAAFAALAVLQIQLSHYFTVDTFANAFLYLAFYAAVRVMTAPLPEDSQGTPMASGMREPVGFYLLFGVGLGLALASKVSTLPVAVLLPLAVLIRFSRLPADSRYAIGTGMVRNLLLAVGVAFLCFRVFQPYAFSGPGFWGLAINPRWVDNLRELSNLSNGDVDFPPALQWARRPVTFAWENMVKWGLGLPLGILAWAGFLWMGNRIIKGEWREHLLLWGWTGLYFTWQSLNFTRAMRYQLPVYPALAVIAAWAVTMWWEKGQSSMIAVRSHPKRHQVLALGLGGLVLVGTFLWAFAFTRIYTRPVTRVAASRWIYQNVPGPISLQIQSETGVLNQPLPVRAGASLTAAQPLRWAFTPTESWMVSQIWFAAIYDPSLGTDPKTVQILLGTDEGEGAVLAVRQVTDTFAVSEDQSARVVALETPVRLDAGRSYWLEVRLESQGYLLRLNGAIQLGSEQVPQRLTVIPDLVEPLRPGQGWVIPFVSTQTGTLTSIWLNRIVDWRGLDETQTLRLQVMDSATGSTLATEEIQGTFKAQGDPRGEPYLLTLKTPIRMEKDKGYLLTLDVIAGEGEIAIYGSAPAHESTWDDGLPLRMDGYDPYGGIYRGGLNFEMYWDDNEEKLARFLSILDQADYIFITSNRQWGTTTRVPERYPLTTVYYRNLLGCPEDKSILWCYSVAQPGMFEGNLGFELIRVFQSDPNLGPLKFNTQFAEEAFTVYDHPKVLIFKKRADYNPAQVHAVLGSADLSKVIRLTPRKFKSYPATLMLPLERWIQQVRGGTWSAFFDTSAWYNRYPGLGLVFWYLVLSVLGWVVYPLGRLVFGYLPDRGYPLLRILALLCLGWGVWVLGSFGVPFTPLTVSFTAVGLLGLNLGLGFLQRKAIFQELRQGWRYILRVEAMALAFFLFFLLVRLGNPDLWHPYKGGEKPMDFSYFNAVIKSTTFPPYDPWFAGGYINYYYFGFVLAAVPTKWLGIVPSIAYNLILPSFFAFVALGAFSAGFNLVYWANARRSHDAPGDSYWAEARPWLGGLAAAVGVLILGNLGTVRMIWQGLQRLVAPNGQIEGANFIQQAIWAMQGLGRLIAGAHLPYAPGDWYWIPSRVYPGEPITEFPFFTFLYADPHAHLFALPLTLLALGWGLAVLFAGWRWIRSEEGVQWPLRVLGLFFLGGLIIGALRPTNTWDLPTYLGLALLAVIFSGWQNGDLPEGWCPYFSPQIRRWIAVGVASLALTGLALWLYAPFSHWYGQAYAAIDLWRGARSPFWSYLTHWGVFLFVLVFWYGWETYVWMATTPLSAIRRIYPYRYALMIGGIIYVGAMVYLTRGLGIEIAWLVMALVLWAGLLLLRSHQDHARRAVLVMSAAALTLTLAVELVVLRGDIGRMNTVFKFYLQAWVLLGVSAAAALTWLWSVVPRFWKPAWQNVWKVGLGLLVGGALLFPLLGGADKIRDRMSPNAPHSLDGMAYMPFSTYWEGEHTLDLSQDYRAIRWMQETVQGSPVIVEANVPEYRWGNRFTIYTGLPGVVGWNWHQRQQRALLPDTWVTERVAAIAAFYNTMDLEEARRFLDRYQVIYIIVGQLEKAVYQAEGLAKFETQEGRLWRRVYQDADTAIYQVIRLGK